jgi:hypothetical protein
MNHDGASTAKTNTFSTHGGHGNQPRHWRYAACVCVFFAMAMLGGCASIKVTPQPIDSPQPVADMGENPIYCLALAAQAASNDKDTKPETNAKTGKHVKLEANQSCWFVVQSDAPENATGLKLDIDSYYEITLPAGQFWFDADRRVPASVGDNGTWFTRTFFTFLKKHPKSPWFALMAHRCGDTTKSQQVSADLNAKEPARQSIIEGFEGELCFYVNDVPNHYENNGGRIFIKISLATR